MIQRGCPTNRVQRKRGREVFHAEHAPPVTPEYLNWSEHPIGFDRSDHPLKIPHPGHHALVLEAQIGGFTSKKVFMDGGSSLNLIYVDTLQKIKIPMEISYRQRHPSMESSQGSRHILWGRYTETSFLVHL
jgi:hypothetical protein